MNNCGDNNVSNCRGNRGFLVIIILYILLAIILGGSTNNIF